MNSKGNIVILTNEACMAKDILKSSKQIEAAIKTKDREVNQNRSSDSWAKVLIHGIDYSIFTDNENGMTDLKNEIEKYNPKTNLMITPRYMTHPDKRIGKAHSSVVIGVQSDDHAKHILKHRLYILGQHWKSDKFLGAKPTDQCSTCQRFGHHWQRCNTSPICRLQNPIVTLKKHLRF
jgi:hypothetical protein